MKTLFTLILLYVLACVCARRVGTKSLLFGVHHFAWHPFTVWRAWIALYGTWPTWREGVCIVIHDWGYWGCPNMDGLEGRRHPVAGAALARWLFGEEEWKLVALHSRHRAEQFGLVPSRLCWADKFSMLYDPQWFYLLRARATGEILEYREVAAQANFLPLAAPHTAWHRKLVSHLAKMATERAQCELAVARARDAATSEVAS